MLVPQAQAPAPAYYPPPAQAYAYPPPPPPVAYYAPPPVAYYAPAYAVWPGPDRNLIMRAGAIGAATARASPTATDRVFDMATGAAAGIASLGTNLPAFPVRSAVRSATRGVVRCRPGIVTDSELGNVPGSAAHHFVLRRVRETDSNPAP